MKNKRLTIGFVLFIGANILFADPCADCTTILKADLAAIQTVLEATLTQVCAHELTPGDRKACITEAANVA